MCFYEYIHIFIYNIGINIYHTKAWCGVGKYWPRLVSLCTTIDPSQLVSHTGTGFFFVVMCIYRNTMRLVFSVDSHTPSIYLSHSPLYRTYMWWATCVCIMYIIPYGRYKIVGRYSKSDHRDKQDPQNLFAKRGVRGDFPPLHYIYICIYLYRNECVFSSRVLISVCKGFRQVAPHLSWMHAAQSLYKSALIFCWQTGCRWDANNHCIVDLLVLDLRGRYIYTYTWVFFTESQ